jgi:hypothetical protein
MLGLLILHNRGLTTLLVVAGLAAGISDYRQAGCMIDTDDRRLRADDAESSLIVRLRTRSP